MYRMLGAMIGLALVLGCGGNGGADLLKLDGGSISREDYRRYVRVRFLDDPTVTALCARFKGMSPQEILDFSGDKPGDEEVDLDPLPERGWQSVPGQVADANDLLDSATIFKEECERITE